MKERTQIIIATMLPREGETGVQAHFNAIADYAMQQGLSVSIVVPYQVNKLVRVFPSRICRILNGINKEWAVLWNRWYLYLCLKELLNKTISSLKNDAITVYAQDLLSARAALSVRLHGYRFRIIAVTHFNISEAYENVLSGNTREGGYLYKNMLFCEREVLRQLDAVIFVSEFNKRHMLSRNPELANVPTYVIPNFIRGSLEQEQDMLCSDIISIGTLEPRKNQQFLLEVLAEAHRLGYYYRLTLVGSGPSLRELEKRADDLHVRDYVNFLGYVKNASKLIPGHRVYVHAAYVENFPIALIEALSCGKPILAPSVGGIPEIYSHGIEGFYWDINDPHGAAQLLIKLLEMQALYKQMSNAAIKRYQTNYATELIAPKLLEVLVS